MISHLQTKRFHLTPILLTDADKVFNQRSDPRVIRYMGRHPMKTVEEALEYLEKTIDGVSKGEYFKWAIREEKDGEFIGDIGIFNIDKKRNRAEIGYALRANYHRKGIMSECLEKILDIAFQELNFHSIGAEIDPYNKASEKLLEKYGFRKEGHFTEDYLFDGKYLDSAYFSLLERWR